MPHIVFPQKKPWLSLEQAYQQTLAHCQAGQWQQAETLYQAIMQTQSAPVHGQYWLSYLDALIKAGKPRATPPAAVPAPEPHPIPASIASIASIRRARPPNPRCLARQARWPWKTIPADADLPDNREMYLLLASYRQGRYAEAETRARKLTLAFPRVDVGWKVLAEALRMQGKLDEARAMQQARRNSGFAGRRKNVMLE